MCKGDTVAAQTDKTLKEHSVVIVSKTSCSYCYAVKYLLTHELGVKAHVMEVNEHPKEKEIRAHMKKLTRQDTFPLVFVDSKYVGNHDDLVELDSKGELEPKMKKHMSGPRKAPSAKKSGHQPLLWFPESVNKWAIRSTGLLTSSTSILSAALIHQPDKAGLIAAVLLGDFVLRFVAGSKFSPMSKLGGALVSSWKPVKRPGAPKQFACVCGIMFSGLGAAFYLNGRPDLGCGFMSMLALASGMEGGLDFCLGCKFFAIGDYIYNYFNKPSAKKL
jgi:glutaredoxin